MMICTVPESRPPLLDPPLLDPPLVDPPRDDLPPSPPAAAVRILPPRGAPGVHANQQAPAGHANQQAPAVHGEADAMVRMGARGCVHAVVDIIRGRRPASQLSRWTTQEIVGSLALLAQATHRHQPRPGRAHVQVRAGAAEIMLPWLHAPLTPGHLPPLCPSLLVPDPATPSAGLVGPGDGAPQVLVRAPGGDEHRRLAAITARVEVHGARWQCTHLGWLTAHAV